MLEALGGRKFVMALIVIAAGCAVDVLGKNGLGAQMAALLGAVYATFSATNAMITNKFSEGGTVEAVPSESSVAIEEIKANIVVNNEKIVNAFTDIAAELKKQNETSTAALEAVTTVQASQNNIQKAVAAILANR